MKCGLPVILQKSPEIVAKASGVRPGHPDYDLADNWTACNANFSDPRVPGFPMPTPTATCNPLFDCVYANEAHPSNASHGANPTCYDATIPDIIANAENFPIVCQLTDNQWCPKGFVYREYGMDDEGNPYTACKEENYICDWGSDDEGYQYGCNTLQGIFQNRLRCLNNFDGDQDATPDPDGPPYQKVCWPFRFSLGRGFRLFFPKEVKVY